MYEGLTPDTYYRLPVMEGTVSRAYSVYKAACKTDNDALVVKATAAYALAVKAVEDAAKPSQHPPKKRAATKAVADSAVSAAIAGVHAHEAEVASHFAQHPFEPQ